MICSVDPMLADAGSGATDRRPEGFLPMGRCDYGGFGFAALTPSSDAGDDLYVMGKCFFCVEE